jgi:hypothetical protein
LCVVLVWLVGRAADAGPELFLDPWRDPAAVERLTAEPALLKPFSRVHLLVFSNGQTVYPTKVAPFGQAPAFGGTHLLAQCREACARVGAKCYWAVDLLQWERADVEGPGLFAKLPQWFELGERGGCGSGSGADPARYVSPFHGEVRAALRSLVAELAAQEPAPDGFTLCCRLSPYDMLGYSVAAREALIAARSLDPIDLNDEGYLAAWSLWRQDYLAALVADLAGAIREKRPKAQIIAWGTGNYYAKGLSLKGKTADNWLAWMQQGAVSEALLDTTWHERWNRAVWGILTRMAQEAKQKPAAGGPPADFLERLHPLVRTRKPDGTPCLEEELKALEEQGAPLTRAVFWPVVAEDWEAVRAVVTRLSEDLPPEGGKREEGDGGAKATAKE